MNAYFIRKTKHMLEGKVYRDNQVNPGRLLQAPYTVVKDRKRSRYDRILS